jgi:hypothetical protein
MTRRITLIAILVLAVAALAFAGETIKRGAAITKDAPKVDLSEVLAHPDKYTKDPVIVEGSIEAACTNKGCWMQLAPTSGRDGVRVTFKDYGFFIPLDAKGKSARAEGVAKLKTLSKEDADHLIAEGAKLKKNEDGTATEVSFVANGVELW